ncbi:MAG: hypothetical protein GY828_08195 [Candidatus Gracilibacteria bacterium]|nr:hypothetical protein [Candidatus Gracilibacteria bacterium]
MGIEGTINFTSNEIINTEYIEQLLIEINLRKVHPGMDYIDVYKELKIRIESISDASFNLESIFVGNENSHNYDIEHSTNRVEEMVKILFSDLQIFLDYMVNFDGKDDKSVKVTMKNKLHEKYLTPVVNQIKKILKNGYVLGDNNKELYKNIKNKLEILNNYI